jgi:hypothetical protein
LIIFIKPTIILHPQEEAAYLDKRLEITNFKKDIEEYKSTGDFPASEPFPKDTLLGLNGQEMQKKLRQKKQKEQEKSLAKEQHFTDASQQHRDAIEDASEEEESEDTNDANDGPSETHERSETSPTETKKYGPRRQRSHNAIEAASAKKTAGIATESKTVDANNGSSETHETSETSSTETKKYGSSRRDAIEAASAEKVFKVDEEPTPTQLTNSAEQITEKVSPKSVGRRIRRKR